VTVADSFSHEKFFDAAFEQRDFRRETGFADLVIRCVVHGGGVWANWRILPI
jgi:hypothetical protein